MRLFLCADDDWPGDLEIVTTAIAASLPSALVLSPPYPPSVLAIADRLNLPRIARLPGTHVRSQADALVWLTDEGWGAKRMALPCAFLRSEGENPYDRIVGPHRAVQREDLLIVRNTLADLLRLAPEHSEAIIRAGKANTEALRAPSWETVANAWAEMESLRECAPRLFLWTVGLQKLLGSWTAAYA